MSVIHLIAGCIASTSLSFCFPSLSQPLIDIENVPTLGLALPLVLVKAWNEGDDDAMKEAVKKARYCNISAPVVQAARKLQPSSVAVGEYGDEADAEGELVSGGDSASGGVLGAAAVAGAGAEEQSKGPAVSDQAEEGDEDGLLM